MLKVNNETITDVSSKNLYPHAKSNVARLTIAQALAGANSTVIYATGAIIGNMLAPSHALATFPISVFVVGMAASSLPAGAIVQRWGRRAVFMIGAGCGVLSGLLAAWAVKLSSFYLFCVATFFGGVYAAVVLSFRFAAADCVPDEQRSRALSFVMAGGVFAGIIGPQLVIWTMSLWAPYPFAATFIAQAVVGVFSALLLQGVRLPRSPIKKGLSEGRSIALILRQPRFITAVICAVVSYLLMNFLMTAAPFAMQMCGLSQVSSNLGIQWHVIAMYAPGFFTGTLIARFGAQRVVTVGLILITLSAITGLLGVDVGHFWLTLILLGIGWNFGFVGASAVVLECHQPEESIRVQSLNDFIVFGTMVFGSFLSGSLLATFGWETVLWFSFIPLIAAAITLVLAARYSYLDTRAT
ncbi:MFS transporter [Candidatus Vallotiella sp. (ex Adelges kitamiensis)]|uniref:MFS transporter n=1 Tax=Candidatus Vallotiella sp. (ex Adelges kitamiensis) TaxID=2864217 RepID=UPI001CE2B0F2|nr:MFS transporter [Candidatus Vallotia sp. (ex Adelges kitamiensis)]